jgi:hypothetical protein
MNVGGNRVTTKWAVKSNAFFSITLLKLEERKRPIWHRSNHTTAICWHCCATGRFSSLFPWSYPYLQFTSQISLY